MGRPSGMAAQKRHLANTLRVELQRQIERGHCAYCRAPASPGRPLTREHVIPRVRGGRRRDVRIIVPACARCNQHRGCMELIPFLLGRPRRISSFLDYLGSLSSESIRQIDPRIFAELYTAIAILSECARHGSEWRSELARVATGRSLHRRRYAARRAIGAISERLHSRAVEEVVQGGPSCFLTPSAEAVIPDLDESIDRLTSRLIAILALLWQVTAERAREEMYRELGSRREPSLETGPDGTMEGVVSDRDGAIALDGWKPRPRRKRLRIDRRRGRVARTPRGRAA